MVPASGLPKSGSGPEAQATSLSHSGASIARGVSTGTGGGAVSGGGEGKGREEWAPLWEALGVLSMPPVSVGTGEWSRCCRCNPPKTLVYKMWTDDLCKRVVVSVGCCMEADDTEGEGGGGVEAGAGACVNGCLGCGNMIDCRLPRVTRLGEQWWASWGRLFASSVIAPCDAMREDSPCTRVRFPLKFLPLPRAEW